MKTLLQRIRPSVLLICLMLTGVCIADILATDGNPKIGLAAVGALAALGKDIIEHKGD